MPFKEVIAAGVFLVREALRSPNFVSGLAGWTINRDGTSEFSGVIVRGTIIVGTVPGNHIEIITTDNPIPQASINFYSGDPQELWPGFVGNQDITNGAAPGGNQSDMQIGSSDDGFGQVMIDMKSPYNAVGSGVIRITTGAPFASGVPYPGNLTTQEKIFQIGSAPGTSPTSDYDKYVTLFLNDQALGLANTLNAWTIGPLNSFNLTADNTSLQARDGAGSFNNMQLQALGGDLSVGEEGTSNSGLEVPTTRDANLATGAFGLAVGPNFSGARMFIDRNEIMAGTWNGGTLVYDPSTLDLGTEGGTVRVGINTPAGVASGLSVPAMDSSRASDTGNGTLVAPAGMVQTITTMGAMPTVTVQRPPSNKLLVIVEGRISGSVAGTQGFIGFEVRDTNAAGTVRLAASSNRSAAVFGTTVVHSSFIYATDALAGTSLNLWVGMQAQAAGTAGSTATFAVVSMSVIPLI